MEYSSGTRMVYNHMHNMDESCRQMSERSQTQNSIYNSIHIKLKNGKLSQAIKNQIALARWLKHHPSTKKVMGSVLSQGTYLDCRFAPQPGCVQEATD